MIDSTPRFFLPASVRELWHDLWINDPAMVSTWRDSLGLVEGSQVVLFDGVQHERLYRVSRLTDTSYRLQHMTDLTPRRPSRHVHVFWQAAEDQRTNLQLLEACARLGVSVFTPIAADGASLDTASAEDAVISGVEQGGWLHVPVIHGPQSLAQAMAGHHAELRMFVASSTEPQEHASLDLPDRVGILVLQPHPATIDDPSLDKAAALEMGRGLDGVVELAVAGVTRLLIE